MSKWRELEKDFRELSKHLQFMRADVTWDGSGREKWTLAAATGQNYEKRFLALAKRGSNYITSIHHLDRDVLSKLIAEPDSVIRWYKAIAKLGNNFDYRFTATERVQNVEHYIHLGSIHNIVDASALLCLELDTEEKEILPSETKGTRTKNSFLQLCKQYAHEIIIGIAVAVIGGLILSYIIQ